MSALVLAVVLAASPLEAGVSAWSAGDVAGALAHLRKAVSDDPRDLESRRALAVILSAEGELDEALTQCEAALADGAATGAARTSLGQLKVELTREKQLGMSAVGLKVLRAELHQAALHRAVAERDVARARRAWGHVRSLQPEQWESSALVGALFLEEGHFADAQRALEEASSRAPAEKQPALIAAKELANRELTYRAQLRAGLEAFTRGELTSAADSLELASRAHPESPEGVEEAVAAMTKLGQWPRALALVRAHVARAEPGRVALPPAQIRRLEKLVDAYEKARTARAPAATTPALGDLSSTFATIDSQLASAQATTDRIQAAAQARDARARAKMSALREKISELEAEVERIPPQIPDLRERANALEAEAKRVASTASRDSASRVLGGLLATGTGATALALRAKAEELERRLPAAQQELSRANAEYAQLESSLQDKWSGRDVDTAPAADDFRVEDDPPASRPQAGPPAQLSPSDSAGEAVASCLDKRNICEELPASSAAAVAAFNKECLRKGGAWKLEPCPDPQRPRCMGTTITAFEKTFSINVLFPRGPCTRDRTSLLSLICVDDRRGRYVGGDCDATP